MARLGRTLAAIALTALVVVALNRPGLCQAGSDVPRDHWAYEAVNDLISKGLVKGFPPDGKFLGRRTATRYEIATIIKRALDFIDDKLSKKADKGATAENFVKPEQLEELRKLVSEFKMELAVIGTDLQKVKDQIGELNAKVDEHGKKLDALGKAVEQAQQDAKDAKQGVAGAIDAIGEQRGRIDAVNKTVASHKISGYIQARFEAFDTGRTSLFTPTASGGTGNTPTNGGPVVGGPWYGFLARRVRTKITGPIGTSGRTDYGIQFDTPSFTSVNVKEAFVNVAGPWKNTAVTVGQFAPPFGWEIPQSSSTRESPERALAFTDTNASSFIWKTTQSAVGGTVTPGSATSLFINQEYDQGLMLSYGPHGTSAPGTLGTKFYLMALNGGGTVAAGTRNLKNGIDLIARAQTSILKGKLDAGVSGYYGQVPVRSAPPAAGPVVAPFANGLKELAGIDLNWHTPWKTTLRAEYVGGVYESSPNRELLMENNHAQSFYVAARHPLTNKLELAAKYEEFMPISEAGKTAGGLGRMQLIRKAAHFGFLYNIDEATRIRFWYEKSLTPFDPSAASGPLRNRLGFLTGELQVKF